PEAKCAVQAVMDTANALERSQTRWEIAEKRDARGEFHAIADEINTAAAKAETALKEVPDAIAKLAAEHSRRPLALRRPALFLVAGVISCMAILVLAADRAPRGTARGANTLRPCPASFPCPSIAAPSPVRTPTGTTASALSPTSSAAMLRLSPTSVR